MAGKTLEEYQEELKGDISPERRLNVEACIRYLSKRHMVFSGQSERPKIRRRKLPNGERT